MTVMQRLSKLSGPRMVLLGGSALLVCASLLPWYRVEGRGFVVEFSGWHDLGVVAWILTIDLLAWELLRLTRAAPATGDRGDRWSAAGGMAVAVVAGIYVLQRLADGGLGIGWFAGAVLALVLGAASVGLFADACGPQGVAAAFGRGEPPVDESGDGLPGWRSRPGPGGPERPAWRAHPEDVAPTAPSGRWEKTLAERQRDGPSLWADRGDGTIRPRRDDRGDGRTS